MGRPAGPRPTRDFGLITEEKAEKKRCSGSIHAFSYPRGDQGDLGRGTPDFRLMTEDCVDLGPFSLCSGGTGSPVERKRITRRKLYGRSYYFDER